jgi:hypothetical protein
MKAQVGDLGPYYARILDKDEFAALRTNARPTVYDPALVVPASSQVREVSTNGE